MFPKGGDSMAAQYSEIQELLRSRADFHARLNLMPYDGTPEIKERGNEKYRPVRLKLPTKLLCFSSKPPFRWF